MYCGLVGPDGFAPALHGNLRFIGPDGSIVADQVKPGDYAELHRRGDARDSYLKAPYYSRSATPKASTASACWRA